MIVKKTTYIYSAILLCILSFPAFAQNNATVPLGNITGSADMKRDPVTTRAQTMGRSDINVTTQSDDFDYEYNEFFEMMMMMIFTILKALPIMTPTRIMLQMK